MNILNLFRKRQQSETEEFYPEKDVEFLEDKTVYRVYDIVSASGKLWLVFSVDNEARLVQFVPINNKDIGICEHHRFLNVRHQNLMPNPFEVISTSISEALRYSKLVASPSTSPKYKVIITTKEVHIQY